jgi:DNA repair exonuclease SbcCD nuclease subunit
VRLLFLTDTHCRGTSPRGRLDDFPATVQAKLAEVVALAEERQVDAVVHGGDLFDRPDVSPAVVRELAAVLRPLRAPLYAVAGNHDVYGHNPATLPRTMLGLLEGLGLLRLLEPARPVFFDDGGIRVQLTGQPFHFDLDRRPAAADYLPPGKEADFAIHVVHGMLLPTPPRVAGLAHTVIEELASTPADLTLTGHYHLGFGVRRLGSRLVANPGALVRIQATAADRARRPAVLLIEVGGGGPRLELVPLTTAQPGEAVLAEVLSEEEAYRERLLDEFGRGLTAAADLQQLEFDEILQTVGAAAGYPPPVRREALRRVAEAQEQLAGEAR